MIPARDLIALESGFRSRVFTVSTTDLCAACLRSIGHWWMMPKDSRPRRYHHSSHGYVSGPDPTRSGIVSWPHTNCWLGLAGRTFVSGPTDGPSSSQDRSLHLAQACARSIFDVPQISLRLRQPQGCIAGEAGISYPAIDSASGVGQTISRPFAFSPAFSISSPAPLG